MAPEQAVGDSERIAPATDVHALGLILYELLTGKPAFSGENVVELLQQVQSREPPPPRQLRPGVAPDLDAICRKCLVKDPAGRYATAEALADDLGRFREGRPTEARPVGVVGRVVYWATRHLPRRAEPR
jgi:serine/threonine protein kinase